MLEEVHPWTHRRRSTRDLGGPGACWIDETTRAIVSPVHFRPPSSAIPTTSTAAGGSYARPHNPTFAQPSAPAALEGGAACLTLASGMAAATAVFMALKPATMWWRRR